MTRANTDPGTPWESPTEVPVDATKIQFMTVSQDELVMFGDGGPDMRLEKHSCFWWRREQPATGAVSGLALS